MIPYNTSRVNANFAFDLPQICMLPLVHPTLPNQITLVPTCAKMYNRLTRRDGQIKAII